jgi:hypothetical protein
MNAMNEEKIVINGVEYVRKDSIESLPKSLEEQRASNPHWPWELGKKYSIRTGTMHDHGTLVGVTEHELVLKNAAWIADSGRWMNYITGQSQPNEVEPFSKEYLVIVGRGALVDAQELDRQFEVQK